ncbi:MAG: NADH-quinone oxidoreductase subunit NuoN [Actinomyces succiniciruminis]|nr:NADH-quinone oxidoreductase subunit NuoN [Actinomyces succiniciruminis]
MSFTAPVIEWAGLTPVLIILGAGVVGVLVEAFVPRSVRPPVQALLSLLAILASAVALAGRWSVVVAAGSGRELTTGIAEDPFGVAAQGILLAIGLLAVLVMADRTTADDGAFAAQAADRPGSAEEEESIHAGWVATEMFPLTLFSLGGMMLFPLANGMITLFVALELVSLPLYIMAAMARHRRLLSQEAALKYFVLGAFSSAFLLMGAAFLYGVSDSVAYSDIAAAIGGGGVAGMDWLALAGVALVTVGLLFKTAAAPFHAWSPDVYQGAPTPVTGFMAAGVKATAFLALVRFYYVLGGTLGWDLAPFLWTVAILTMAVGTVVGVIQKDVKRMLAYSAIAHAGYMLIGIIAWNGVGVSALLLYALTYGIATVGAFGIIGLVRTSHDGAPGAEANDLEAFTGLGRRSPWLAGAMTVFLLSFAGIPLTAGFMAKFEVFIAGIAGGATWLVIVAIVSSVATAFFYMRLIVLMFFREPDGDRVVVVGSMGPAALTIGLAAAATVLIGVLPQAVVSSLADAAMLLP